MQEGLHGSCLSLQEGISLRLLSPVLRVEKHQSTSKMLSRPDLYVKQASEQRTGICQLLVLSRVSCGFQQVGCSHQICLESILQAKWHSTRRFDVVPRLPSNHEDEVGADILDVPVMLRVFTW